MQESRIDDFWNIDESRDLSDSWTGFTQSILLSEKPPEGYMWSGERLTKRQATSRPYHLWPEHWRGLPRNAQRREKHKWAIEKKQSAIMLEDYEESISLTPRTRSSRKPLRMQEENWKHQWLQPCLAGHASKATMERPVARLMISRLNLRVSWKPVNPQENVWEESLPTCHEDHIAGRGDNSLQHYNLVHNFISMPQAIQIPAAKAAVDKDWEKLE